MRHVGRFEIRGPLGRGGAGAVFRAYDPELGREVALKLLLAAGQERARRRFRTEGEALVRLRHPHLVTVHEAGEERGQPYLVLALVEGTSLGDLLREQGALAPAQAVELTTKLASALSAVHAAGLVHRDLKPDNVVLRASDQEPVLIDFGLARDLAASQGPTRTGQALGSPGYWAPEQAAGQTDRMGPWTDVYGLGGVLYACLTGRPPVEAGNFTDAIVATLRQVPDLPSESSAGIDAALDAICLTCLAKEPSQRYPDAAALLSDLERYARGAPLSAGARRPGPRAGWALPLATAGLLLCGGVALWAAFAGEARGPAPGASEGSSTPSETPAALGPPGFPALPARAEAASASASACAAQLRAGLAELKLPAWSLLLREAALAPPGSDPAALALEAERAPPSSREHLAPLARAARLGWAPAVRRVALGALRGGPEALPLADPALGWRLLAWLLAVESREALPALLEALETDPRGLELVRALGDSSLGDARRAQLNRELRALLVERWALPPRSHSERRLPITLGLPERTRRARLLLERVATLGEPWAGAVNAAADLAPQRVFPSVPPRGQVVGSPRWLQLAGQIVKVTQTLGEVRGFRLLASFKLLPPGSVELELQRRCVMHLNFSQLADIQTLVVAGLSWIKDASLSPARRRELALATFRISRDISKGATDRVRRALFSLDLSGVDMDEDEVQRFPLAEAWRLYWIAAEADLVALGWAEPLPE